MVFLLADDTELTGARDGPIELDDLEAEAPLGENEQDATVAGRRAGRRLVRRMTRTRSIRTRGAFRMTGRLNFQGNHEEDTRRREDDR